MIFLTRISFSSILFSPMNIIALLAAGLCAYGIVMISVSLRDLNYAPTLQSDKLLIGCTNLLIGFAAVFYTVF